MKPTTLTKSLLTFFGAAALATSVQAATIVQGGLDTIAFEAEIGSIDNTFDNAALGWEVDGVTAPLAGASGGSLVVAAENHSAAPANTITYNIDFTKTGNYDAWFRAAYTTQDYENFNDTAVNNDSFYYEDGTIGDAPSWREMNGISGLSDTVWLWFKGTTTVVVGSAGTTDWLISNREDGFIIDRLVLIHEDDVNPVNDAFLDGLSNSAVPEPSSAALLGVAGLALILRRKR
ncbi:MAG: PEP-CTERM sorting domain-containing protein [Verrucomicrobiae bacterium]|nr:PEP-CTERM sorting domain-containing protein [Verrucomicrobiae bacterium]NNJ43727.1 PEP-CTERM sorting domain-containing protein [Akkermansiaceae bacterium]